ncbi:DUF1028 domain-containing protein [Galbitalea sp. SE-J8]|nr:DUF1028 domain-containing protein [Galbitalea sp. SE-J8]
MAAHSGALAIATASYSLAVGNAVPALVPGVGAAASQAYTNRALRSALLDELARGPGPSDAIEAMRRRDAAIAFRQLAVLGADGAGAATTGERCSGWAGQLLGPGWIAIGNLLAGGAVLDAMAGSIDGALGGVRSALDLAAAAVGALRAGEAAGGDRRGPQSAALLAAAGGGGPDSDLDVDVRADHSADPLSEIDRLLALAPADIEGRARARAEVATLRSRTG